MNPFEMVVIIVAIVMVSSVLMKKLEFRSRHEARRQPAEEAENKRLREEVKQLKERLQVLERIATDRENSLARQIDELRDR